MRECALCMDWAQWRTYFVEKAEEKQEFAIIYAADNTPQKKPLVPRAPKLIPGPVLCGKHKLIMEREPSEIERRFVFAGAIPLGT